MRTPRRFLTSVISLAFLLSACNLVLNAPSAAADDLAAGQTAVAQTVAAELTLAAPLATTPPVPPADTATPTPTITELPPAPAGTCDQAYFVSETIPDNTAFLPGTPFSKTWRLRNVGTCTWTSSYALVFDHGDSLGAPAAIPLAGAVAPGQEIDLSVNMQAPVAPGTFIGHWRLRNASGGLFYTNSTSTFTVQILVTAPTPTFTATLGGLVIDPGILIPFFPLGLLPSTDFELAQASISAGSTGSAAVNCPEGSLVVGGGFAGTSDLLIYSAFKDGNGWRAYAENNSASGKTLNAYAICLYNSSGTTSQQYTQVSVPAGNIGHSVANCPAGSVVTGGGFASSPGDLWVYNSSQAGNSWQVYARNTSGSSQLLNAYAMCLSGTAATTTQVGTNLSIAAGASDGKPIACPSGLVTGGGFALSEDMVLYNSSMLGNMSGWQGFANNTSGGSALMNIYATCLRFP